MNWRSQCGTTSDRENRNFQTTNLGVRSSNLFGRASDFNDLTGRASRINIFADPMRTRREQGRSARGYNFPLDRMTARLAFGSLSPSAALGGAGAPRLTAWPLLDLAALDPTPLR